MLCSTLLTGAPCGFPKRVHHAPMVRRGSISVQSAVGEPRRILEGRFVFTHCFFRLTGIVSISLVKRRADQASELGLSPDRRSYQRRESMLSTPLSVVEIPIRAPLCSGFGIDSGL